MGASPGTSFTSCATEDKIEDTRTQEFNKPQQSSKSLPDLIETEADENSALSRNAGIRLDARGRAFKSLGPDQ